MTTTYLELRRPSYCVFHRPHHHDDDIPGVTETELLRVSPPASSWRRHTWSYGDRVTACFTARWLSLAHRLNSETVELLQLFHRSVGTAGWKESLSEDTEWIVAAVTELRVWLRDHLHSRPTAHITSFLYISPHNSKWPPVSSSHGRVRLVCLLQRGDGDSQLLEVSQTDNQTMASKHSICWVVSSIILQQTDCIKWDIQNVVISTNQKWQTSQEDWIVYVVQKVRKYVSN